MGLTELAARVGKSGANGALVISMWKGNPSLLVFTNSAGEEVASIKMESAKLRREVNREKKTRVAGTAGIFLKSDSSTQTRELADLLSSFLGVETFELAKISDAQVEEHWSLVWLEDLPSGKTLWTHYNSTDGVEIGPRIRVTSIRRKE
ncbi:MAG: hypothetical protein ACFFE2_02120 [Candidatus Thorarchaeota archaeon]